MFSYQSPCEVNACCPRVRTVEPLRLGKAKKAMAWHYEVSSVEESELISRRLSKEWYVWVRGSNKVVKEVKVFTVEITQSFYRADTY